MQLHRHGLLFAESHGEDVENAYSALFKAQVDELSKLVDETTEATARITKDGGLNQKGIQERVSEVSKEALNRLQDLGKRRRKLEQDLGKAQQALPETLPNPPLRSENPVLYFLKLQEIRELLADMDGLERLAAAKQAAETNDLDLLLAVQEAPRLMPLVSQEAFDEAKNRWYEVNRPDAYKMLATVHSALTLFDFNARRAEDLVTARATTTLRHEGLRQDQIDKLVFVT